MKIIILCNSLSGGGAEKVASDTVSILKKLTQYNIKVASSDLSADIPLKKSKSNNFFKAFFNFSNFFVFFKALKVEKPDVIHIHNFLTELTISVLVSIWFYKLFYDKKIRVVQTLHDHHLTCPNSSLYDDHHQVRCVSCINGSKVNIIKNKCYQASRLKSVFKYLRFSLLKALTRYCNIIDVFLCPSEFIRDMLLKDGVAQNRTEIVRNPIQDVFFKSDLIQDNNLSSKVNIIYLGRLVKIKSIETIVDAIKLNTAEELEITADICGDGELKGHLSERIKELGLSNKIILRGKVDVFEMKKIASNSDVLVLPSIVFENAPLVVYEAVSMGLFPIVSNIGGMLEAVNTIGYGDVFEAGDPQSLKDAIHRYVLNKEQINKNKNQAQGKVINLCSEMKYKQALKLIYESPQSSPIS